VADDRHLGVVCEHAGEDRPGEDRDVRTGFDEAGRAEHLVLLHVLRQEWRI
jgi:hypothetical protein